MKKKMIDLVIPKLRITESIRNMNMYECASLADILQSANDRFGFVPSLGDIYISTDDDGSRPSDGMVVTISFNRDETEAEYQKRLAEVEAYHKQNLELRKEQAKRNKENRYRDYLKLRKEFEKQAKEEPVD